jgi:hypothetical protein
MQLPQWQYMKKLGKETLQGADSDDFNPAVWLV